MENIIADTRIKTAMQASIDQVLSEKGLSDLFYNNYVSDFYVIIDETDEIGFRLVIERMGNFITVIYDYKLSGTELLKGKQHLDVEMTFHLPSWEPLTLKHHRFTLSHKSQSLENLSTSLLRHEPEIKGFSKMWASLIQQHEMAYAIKFEWGYKIDGVWRRERIRER